MRRFLLFLLLLALAVPSLVVLGTNVVLKVKLRSWVNDDPESTFLTYDDASSDAPGRILVKNVVLRSRDLNAEWIARVGEARLTVSLLDLARRRFHATSVRGSGLSYRLRRRLRPDEITPQVVEGLPPIEGFPSPPRADPTQKTRPEEPSRWRVELDDLALERTSEIWIEGFRFQGAARIAGGFFIHPTMTAQVLPSRLDVSSGSLRFGSHPLAEPLSGAVSASIPSFRTHEYPGDEIWKIVRGRVRLDGGVASLEFLNALLGEPKRPRFGAGKGRIHFETAVGSGSGSGALFLEASGVEARFGDATIRSHSAADVRAKHVDFKTWAADFSGSSLAITDAAVTGRDPESGWWGTFTFAPSRLDMESGLWTTRIAARAKSPRPILTMLDVNVSELGTKLIKLENLTATADVRLAKRRVEVHGLEVAGGGALVEGEYAKRASAAGGAFLV
ncbi:MAG TPA: hypothetical protein VKF32_16015, partial [Thermoanaerobaculia bacterium]|nr:hypothetical protein [Thermoanaerobaculia bacterium]